MTEKKDRELRGMLASGAGLVLIKFVNAGLGIATVTLFARFLPPGEYGIYVLALTISQFLALPLQMGIPVLLTREIAIAQSEGRPEVIKGLRQWTRRLLLLGTLGLGTLVIGVYTVVIAAGWPILKEFSWPIVLLIVGLIPVIAEMKRVMGILNGYRRPAQSRLPDGVVRPVLLVLVGAFGLSAGWFGQIELLAVYLSSALCAAAFGWFLVGRVQGKSYQGPAEMRSAEWRAALGPLTIFAAASTIKTYSDILMLGIMDSPESVAFYRVATQIAGVALLVQTAVNAILSPRMAALHSQGRTDRMQALAVRSSRLVLGGATAFGLGSVVVGAPGYTLLLGEEYAPVYNLTLLMIFGMGVSGCFGGTIMMLNMTRREKSTARYAGGTAIGNIVLNLGLIPFLGALGAALATVITMIAMQFLAWRQIRRDLGIRTDAFARVNG